MYMFLLIGVDALLTTAVAAPILAILVLTVYKGSPKRRMAVLLLFAYYIAAVFGAVGLPVIRSVTFDFTYNVIPFFDALNSPVNYLRNTLLNILLFIPLGCFAPLLWKKFWKLRNLMFLGLGVSLLIEICQIFTFRITDIEDLIMNTAGAVAGWFIVKGLLRGGRLHFLESLGKEKKSELAVLIGVVFAARFLVR